jgi:E3 ubiquitin-protein ligase DOA10
MQCRYCLEQTNTFIFPCKCKTPVHQECLMKWLHISKRQECEICLAKWPTIIKTVRRIDWWWNVFTTLFFMAIGGLIVHLGLLNIILKAFISVTAIFFSVTVMNMILFVPVLMFMPTLSPILAVCGMLYISQHAIQWLDYYI